MISERIYQFLETLSKNNNREWFLENKKWYDECKLEIDNIAAKILKELKLIDNRLASIEVKDCVYRIYRDVRFSKDKTPYKTHFGIYFAPGGKSSWNPGYYLHIEPNNSFFGGGVWMPQSSVLKAIRQEIYYNAEDFISILNEKNLKKYFNGLDETDKIQRPPKDYSADFKHIEILKNKSFLLTHKLSNKDICGGKSIDFVIDGFKTIYPLNVFLNNAFQK